MRIAIMALLSSLLAVVQPGSAHAGCGCEKPPPPLAAVRPFVGWKNEVITLFDARLVLGQKYWVQFKSMDGTMDTSKGKAVLRRDFADNVMKPQIRVRVADVPLGPCTITVWNVEPPSNPASNKRPLYSLSDDQFTVAASPVGLDDSDTVISQDAYRAGVGRDGSIYIPLDVSAVSDATTFTGAGMGFPLQFGSYNIAMYNDQGFLMQLLDPTVPGLFQINQGDGTTSNVISYWRHEFRTYKAQHRHLDNYLADDDDPNWHADGTYHVNHDTIVVAIRGTLPDGSLPAPGATPPFQLGVVTQPAAQLN
jgi:hypothetical protein